MRARRQGGWEEGAPTAALQLGLFFGGFAGLYKGACCTLRRWTTLDERAVAALAGAAAAAPVALFDAERRRTLCLYAIARASQCWYNSAKARGAWHFYGSDWSHGDALLFVLSSAQVCLPPRPRAPLRALRGCRRAPPSRAPARVH